jgi:Ni/Fe-hydrogenase subunit HybB-like protein
MQKHCVFREVEAAFLYIIYTNLGVYGWAVPLAIHRQCKSNKMTTVCLMNTNFEILMTFEYIFETFPCKDVRQTT